MFAESHILSILKSRTVATCAALTLRRTDRNPSAECFSRQGSGLWQDALALRAEKRAVAFSKKRLRTLRQGLWPVGQRGIELRSAAEMLFRGLELPPLA